jgi:EDD domain protein, DegV family
MEGERMAKVKILSDSTSDLPDELLEKYEIGLIPLYVNLDGTVLPDNRVDITSQIIYDSVRKTGVLPGTIGVPAEDFKAEFEKWRGQGYEIVCHTISSDMSCTYQNAKIAAAEMDGVYLVDSRSLSSGVGHLVLHSAELARRGLAAAEIAASTSALVPKVSATFVIDSLDYLKKGGRCSTLAALGANLLKIKPMIVVDNGNMKVGHKFRGLLPKVLEEYVDMQLETQQEINTHRIFITHTGCSADIVAAVRRRIEKNLRFDEILESNAGATITSHSGPNTLGILFLKQ